MAGGSKGWLEAPKGGWRVPRVVQREAPGGPRIVLEWPPGPTPGTTEMAKMVSAGGSTVARVHGAGQGDTAGPRGGPRSQGGPKDMHNDTPTIGHMG